MNQIISKGKRYALTGLLVIVPAWGTFLILSTLLVTLDGIWVDLLGPFFEINFPGAGIALLMLVILIAGMMGTHFLGQRLMRNLEESLERIPIVRSIYNTLKGMADVFQFRERFGQSAVVVFPFPRAGLWAIGFVMGQAPRVLQVAAQQSLLMVFVPTAIHPFTGYLAFVPHGVTHRIALRPQEAMKLEFSAGMYQPPKGWLSQSHAVRAPSGHQFPSEL